jgi:hypothetical protein
MKRLLSVAIALSSGVMFAATAIAQSLETPITYQLNHDLDNPNGGIWQCDVVENPWLYIQPIDEVPCLQVFPELGFGEAEPFQAPTWNYPGIDYTDASNWEFLPEPIGLARLSPGENAPVWFDLLPNSHRPNETEVGLKTNGSLNILQFNTTAITWLLQQYPLPETTNLTVELAATESLDLPYENRSMRVHMVDW